MSTQERWELFPTKVTISLCLVEKVNNIISTYPNPSQPQPCYEFHKLSFILCHP
jgi:hypothetical protein